MSPESYYNKKCGNIKGKRIRETRRGCRRSKNSRNNRAGWNNSLSQSHPLPNNLPLYVSAFPDYLTCVPWSYRPNPYREIIYYLPASALELLLKSQIEQKVFWKYLYILNLIQLAYFRYQVSKSGSKCATRHRFKRRHLSECFFMGFMRFEGKPDFSFGSFYL
jgi:hypothetical protein